MIQYRSYVGLDVHARTTQGCVIVADTGEIVHKKLAANTPDIVAWVSSLPGPRIVTYEAGPTGFGLYRQLVAAGIDCEVAAPSKLQRPVGDRVKTDARDAEHLAKLLRLGQIVVVRVPSAEAETVRDVVRAREDTRQVLMGNRHQLSKLLLRHGYVYDDGAVQGRLRLARLMVEQGWSSRRAAERFQCSPATASKWAARYRAGLPMTDRSSRPHHSPSRSPQRLERRIIALRFVRRWGPHRIGYHLGIPRSTVGRVLGRYSMPPLQHLDQATGLPVCRPKPIRYEKTRPGELVHVDIKKLGRIPDGGVWRAHGRGSAQDRRAGVARDRAARHGAWVTRRRTEGITTSAF